MMMGVAYRMIKDARTLCVIEMSVNSTALALVIYVCRREEVLVDRRRRADGGDNQDDDHGDSRERGEIKVKGDLR